MHELAFRLQNLGQSFAVVDSPEQLENLMVEGGVLLCDFIDAGKLPIEDFEREQVKECRKPPIPRWDTSLPDFRHKSFFVHCADKFSDRPRTLYRNTEQDGSSCWRETKWNEDYRHQGQRYSLFCAELVGTLSEATTQLKMSEADMNRMLKIARDIRDDRRLETDGKGRNHIDRKAVYDRVAKAKETQSQRASEGRGLDLYLLAIEHVDKN